MAVMSSRFGLVLPRTVASSPLVIRMVVTAEGRHFRSSRSISADHLTQATLKVSPAEVGRNIKVVCDDRSSSSSLLRDHADRGS
jgi:hypothetical protein